ncbi:MAG TPA: DUF4249 domain-containing protein [Chitinophagaceae bacterium]|nr:DUF4249 domain-containing protein [Chitinophagaceae bacterium]
MKWRMWLLLLVSFLAGCEKNITLNLHNQNPVLVVDAEIENGQPPVVVLSASLNYFSTISPSELAATFVHGAHITVSNGSTTVVLKEFSNTDSSGFKVYYYTANEGNPDSVLLGQLNRQYTLSITTADGQNYTSTTTIPPLAKTLDSLWWKPAPDNPDTSRCVMFGQFTDPKGYGNYIRYFTKVNSGPYLTASNSAFDDEFTDGQTYSLQFDMGYDRNVVTKNNDDIGFAHRGDTVTVKFCNIDKASYDFWRTWEFAYQSTNNPFSSPVKVSGNVSNGALGAFCGYAAEYKTIIIPK